MVKNKIVRVSLRGTASEKMKYPKLGDEMFYGTYVGLVSYTECTQEETTSGVPSVSYRAPAAYRHPGRDIGGVGS